MPIYLSQGCAFKIRRLFMSNFSVTNNYYLYNLYKDNSLYAIQSKRSGAKPGALLSADSKALMKGVKVLSAADYGDEEDDSTTETKTFYKKLKSFADAYNYTMESSEEVGDRSTKKIRKELDALREEYAEDLERYGITFNNKGYMKLNKNTIDEIDKNRYEKFFGADSELTKTISKLANKLHNHVDYQI